MTIPCLGIIYFLYLVVVVVSGTNLREGIIYSPGDQKTWVLELDING